MNENEETGGFLNQIVTYAFVVKGPFKDIDAVADHISKMPESRIVYRKASVGKLFIEEENRHRGRVHHL